MHGRTTDIFLNNGLYQNDCSVRWHKLFKTTGFDTLDKTVTQITFQTLMNATWQTCANTTEHVSTTMVHMFVTALMGGKDSTAKMVCIG